ncbi:hypothetical protein IMSHALPRED_008252 [Imshaugia aleurites]|uniref:Uncharacterized protein n=1 Tax=Imshaugia aleurites TaxID=172621 RepID=A0A8H3FR52_9LECA|nr:hypothetical protein IMSHALPRED_008252 [Imshaugia aleurites]
MDYEVGRVHGMKAGFHQGEAYTFYASYDAGAIPLASLAEAQDCAAAADSVEQMVRTGETLVTDVQQRASPFATYALIDTLAGAPWRGIWRVMGGIL